MTFYIFSNLLPTHVHTTSNDLYRTRAKFQTLFNPSPATFAIVSCRAQGDKRMSSNNANRLIGATS